MAKAAIGAESSDAVAAIGEARDAAQEQAQVEGGAGVLAANHSA